MCRQDVLKSSTEHGMLSLLKAEWFLWYLWAPDSTCCLLIWYITPHKIRSIWKNNKHVISCCKAARFCFEIQVVSWTENICSFMSYFLKALKRLKSNLGIKGKDTHSPTQMRLCLPSQISLMYHDQWTRRSTSLS